MKLNMIATLFLAIVPAAYAQAQSALDRATTQCLFEVENGGDLHVTVVNRGGKETLRVKNKKRRAANDPTVAAYKACVQNKLATGTGAAPAASQVSGSQSTSELQVASNKPKKAPSGKAQRKVLFACKEKLGIGGTTKMSSEWRSNTFWGGTTVVRVLPHDQVSVADADRINACADRTFGMAPKPVATRSAKRPRSVERETRASNSLCPRYAPVIYRGTRYCIGNQ